MSYFLSHELLASGQETILSGPEAEHLLKARRIRKGEKFQLQDIDGNRFEAELVLADRGRATAKVIRPLPVPPPPAVRVSLLQAAVKERAMEWIIQKTTELGVAELIVFPSENSTVSEKQLAGGKIRERWLRVAWEASKQCERQFPPDITIHQTLEKGIEVCASGGWVLDLAQGVSPETARRKTGMPSRMGLLIGPEGGLLPQEIDTAKKNGYLPIRLGETVLRAETAAVAGLTLLLHGE